MRLLLPLLLLLLLVLMVLLMKIELETSQLLLAAAGLFVVFGFVSDETLRL